MKLIIFTALMIFSSLSWAFIPPGMMILQRTAENNGSGIYQIELEVQFPGPLDTLNLKETWLIENENSMKLIISTSKDNREIVLYSFHYAGGQRVGSGDSKKLDDDFIEKYFHFRNSQKMANDLIQMKIATPDLVEKSKIANIKTYAYRSEDFLRFSRVGGVVTYAFGTPAPNAEEAGPPGMWIEQDQFILRKIRLPSQVEVNAEKHSIFSRGFIFPRLRYVRWDSKQVQINTLSVVSRKKDSVAGFGSKLVTKTDALLTHPSWPIVEEFYKRFR